MKHDQLRSIAHNIAASLASGIGLPIGIYDIDVFGEAAASSEKYIEVNFLDGTTSGGPLSSLLATAVSRYANWLPALCESHGADISHFTQLTARYRDKHRGGWALVTVEDQNGRRSLDEYYG